MRVLYVHRHAGGSTGGAWNALCRMETLIRRRGASTELLLTHGAPSVEGSSWNRVSRVPLPPARKGKSLPWYPAAVSRLASFLRDCRPDVVHLNDLDDAIFFVLARRIVRPLPLVSHARNFHPPGKFRKAWAHRVDRLICVSDGVRKAAIEGGVEPGRCLVVHDPADAGWNELPSQEERRAWRSLLALPPEAPVIGTVGHISPTKGTDILVESLPFVTPRFPSLRCVVVGADDRGLQRGLEARARELGVGKNLIFTGAVRDPRVVVSLMDLFVLPSRSEGYGLSLLEAMTCGKPAVAARVGGIPELLVDGQTGVLVPPGSPEELGQAISGLLSDPALRQRMGNAAASRARLTFGEEEVQGLFRLYSSLLEEIA